MTAFLALLALTGLSSRTSALSGESTRDLLEAFSERPGVSRSRLLAGVDFTNGDLDRGVEGETALELSGEDTGLRVLESMEELVRIESLS